MSLEREREGVVRSIWTGIRVGCCVWLVTVVLERLDSRVEAHDREFTVRGGLNQGRC